MPVLIRDSGNANVSDQMIVTYATPAHVVNSVLIVDKPMAVSSDVIYVQSPNGFRVNDRIIVNAKNGGLPLGGDCELSTVTAVTLGDSLGNVTTGMVALSHPPLSKATYLPTGSTDGASVLNLGQVGEASRTFFDVGPGAGACTPAQSCQLRSTDLLTPGATAVPIAQNVVLFKAQYGVDCAANGVITWTSATASGVCGRNYTPDDFMPPAPAVAAQGMTTVQYAQWLSRIRAVRIAVVVRSDEPDLKDPALVGQTATLFDCSTHDAACQGSVAIDNTVLYGRLALPDVRDDRPDAQRDLQQRTVAMPARAPLSVRPRAQRGVVLFIALIAMVVLSLAGVALIRAVDTSGSAAGNIAFREASVTAVNLAIEQAVDWLYVSKTLNPDTDVDTTHHYYGKLQAGELSNGLPAVLVRHVRDDEAASTPSAPPTSIRPPMPRCAP